MQILGILGFAVATTHSASLRAGLPTSLQQGKVAEVPTVGQVDRKIRALMDEGVFIDPFLRRNLGPYEGAAASASAFSNMRRLLAGERPIGDERLSLRLLAKNFHEVEFLLRYYRPLFPTMEFELSEEELDRVVAQFAREGFPVQRTLGLRFRDVPEGHWGASAVHALRDAGILTGYPDAKFRG